eukprot:11215070-Lingulodinium_polyedra.AAC.1
MQIDCARAHSRKGHVTEAKRPRLRQCPCHMWSMFANVSRKMARNTRLREPVKGVRHRRSEPGNMRLSKDD